MLLLFWNAGARATPSITLALAPVTVERRVETQASPSITIEVEVHAIGSYVLAGGSVIELEYNA